MRHLLHAGIAGLFFCGTAFLASNAAALSAGAHCDVPRSTTRAADRLERLRSTRRVPPGWWSRNSAGHPGNVGNHRNARRGNHAERRHSPSRWVSDRPARRAPNARQARPEPPSHLHRGAQHRPGPWPGRARAAYLDRQQARLHRHRWMRYGHTQQRSAWRQSFLSPAAAHPRTASTVARSAYGHGHHRPAP
jgi:hypothetical protein